MNSPFNLRTEQWFFFGALIFLGILAGYKALTLPDLNESLPAAKQKSPSDYDTEKIESISERWNTPSVIGATDHEVYVSRMIVYVPATQKIMPLFGENEIQGMKVGWLNEHGLSLEDPNVAISDTDKDGFSNKEEFDANTDPKDIASHPDLLNKLCVQDYEFIAFNLEFKGYVPDPGGSGYTYLINLLDVKRNRTRRVRQGDELKGYEIGEFTKKYEERFNEKTQIKERVEVSSLVITNKILNKPMSLTLNVPAESDESKITFRLNVPHVQMDKSVIKIGETFKIKDQTYQLIEASAEKARIRNVDTADEFSVGKCK